MKYWVVLFGYSLFGNDLWIEINWNVLGVFCRRLAMYLNSVAVRVAFKRHLTLRTLIQALAVTALSQPGSGGKIDTPFFCQRFVCGQAQCLLIADLLVSTTIRQWAYSQVLQGYSFYRLCFSMICAEPLFACRLSFYGGRHQRVGKFISFV